MDYVLAVDGGNTKTIAVVATTTGRVVGVGRGGCSDIYGAGSADAGTAVLGETVIAALASAELDAKEIGATAFSLAGADWPEDIDLLSTFLADRFALTDPLVVNDAIGGLRSGAPDWVGIAVVCGTFNAVGARNADGRVFHLGFWPDRTGAYDLSIEALKAVYRAGLDLGPATALTDSVLALFGADDALDLLHRFTHRGNAMGRNDLTQLAPLLLDTADEGDPVARAIVVQAGTWLGDEGRVAAQRVGLPLDGAPVVLSGGVLQHPTDLLADAVLARLDGARAVRCSVPPIVGALLLALDRAGAGAGIDADRLADAIWSGGR